MPVALRPLLSPDWLRIELICIAAVHVALGAVVAFAPADLVVTPGSRPVFEIWPSRLTVEDNRWLWGYLFLAGGLMFAYTAIRQRFGRLMVALMIVGFGHGMWTIAFAIALRDGRGSAIGTVLFPALLLWCGFAGIRVLLSLLRTGK